MTHGDLRVDVAPDALLFNGHVVLGSTFEDSDDLTYALFREGARAIVFLPGLPAEELAAFLDLLVVDATGDDGRADDDRVTLIWNAALEHVALETVDLFTNGSYFVRNPEYRQRFEQRVQSLLQRAAPALVASGPLIRPGRPAAKDVPVENAYDPLLQGFSGFALAGALASPADPSSERAVRALLDDDARWQPVRFLEVLCDAMAPTTSGAERKRAAEHAVRLLEDVMAANDLDTLAACMDALRGHCRISDARHDARRAFVDEILGPLARYHRLILLRPALAEGRRDDLERLMSFFELLPRSELEGLVSFLSKLNDGPAARPLRELLERRGADLTPYHVGRLKSENVLVVLDSLRIIAGSANPQAQSALMGLLDNRNPSVRRQAMLALKGRWSTEVFTQALRFLQAGEVGLRLAALEVIAAARDPEMAEPLRTIAERPDFAKCDADERHQHLSALLACDRAATVAWLKTQLSRRNLFGRRQSQALIEGGVLALLDHDGPDTRQILAEWVSGEPASSALRQRVEPILTVRLAEEDDAQQEIP
jgi:hypothetical protein